MVSMCIMNTQSLSSKYTNINRILHNYNNNLLINCYELAAMLHRLSSLYYESRLYFARNRPILDEHGQYRINSASIKIRLFDWPSGKVYLTKSI